MSGADGQVIDHAAALSRRWLPERYYGRAFTGVTGAWFILLGNVLEWYEFSLFGYLSSEMRTNFFAKYPLAVWAGMRSTWFICAGPPFACARLTNYEH